MLHWSEAFYDNGQNDDYGWLIMGFLDRKATAICFTKDEYMLEKEKNRYGLLYLYFEV